MDNSEFKINNWLSLFGIIETDINTNKKNEFWISDDNAIICSFCYKSFTLFQRRHHCRICGMIFCIDCLNKIIEVKCLENNNLIKVCEKCYNNYNTFIQSINKNILINDNQCINKSFYYIENILNIEYNDYKFSKFNNFEQEKAIIYNLNSNYIELVKIMIFNVLHRNIGEKLTIKWNTILQNIVLKIIEYIKPSSKYLNDSLEIMDNIKIKVVESDIYESRIIKGFIMKNVDTNNLLSDNIDKAYILIVEQNDFVDLNNVENKEAKIKLQIESFKIIQKKIENMNCNLILLKGNLPNYLNDLIKNKNKLISNIQSKNLEKISRCINAFILPSFYLIGSTYFFFGKCKTFYKEKIKDSNNEIIKELLVFENNEKLFSSIILSKGNKNELKSIKQLLKKIILPTAWDLYLQKCLIYTFNYDINNEKIPKYRNNYKENVSTLSNLFIQPSLMKKNKLNKSQIKKFNPYIEGFETSIIEKKDKFNNTSIYKMTMSIGSKNIESNNLNSVNDIEKFILKTNPKICTELINILLKYYDKNEQYDKSLGQLFFDLSKISNITCNQCNLKFSEHFYYMFKNKKKIKISLLNNENLKQYEKIIHLIPNQNKDNNKYNLFMNNEYSKIKNDIYIFGFCKICNDIVTPINKMTNDLYNYSSTKFFERLILCNNKNFNKRSEFNSKNIANLNCTHNSIDIKRFFIDKFSCWEFEINNVEIYNILPMNLNFYTKDNTLKDKIFISYQKNSYKSVNYLFNEIKKCYDNEIQLYVILKDKNTIEEIKIFIDDMIEILKKNYSIFDIIKNDLIEEYLNKQNEIIDSYVILNVYIKEIYIQLGKFKMLLNKIHSIMLKIKLLNQMKKDSSDKKIEELFGENESQLEIDSDQKYLKMLNHIFYYDEFHKTFSSEINIDDLSSIIAYSLTSDIYIEFINQGDLKISECKRNIHQKSINEFLDENQINTDLHKNYIKLSKELFFDSLLLFEQSKQRFYFNNNQEKKDNMKILEELKKTILFSEEKSRNFIYSMKENLKNLIYLNNTTEKKEIKELYFLNENFYKYSEELELFNKIINEKSEFFNNIITNYFKSINMEISFFEQKYSMKKPYIESQFNQSKYPTINIITFFPKQFEALRTLYCDTYTEFILSISKSKEWSDVSGGKSKANFYKSIDGKYIFKCISKVEFDMFIKSANEYFIHMQKYLFEKMPSILAKILGIYKIEFIEPYELKQENYYVVVMENIYYGLIENNNGENNINNSLIISKKNNTSIINNQIENYINNNINKENGENYKAIFFEKKDFKCYDLKGSKIRRYIQKDNNKENQVLLDTNFIEDFTSELIIINRNIDKLFKNALHNDTLFLSHLNIIDYSLFLLINNKNKIIKFGIIDYIRKYTWDKKLEHISKKVLNGTDPTIIEPKEYRKRFLEHIQKYIIGI